MFFLIYLLSANQSIYSSILQHKSLLLLGNASFAIYILQAPIRNYYNYLHLPSYMIFAYPLVLILFSILIYLKLEYPVNKKHWRLFQHSIPIKFLHIFNLYI